MSFITAKPINVELGGLICADLSSSKRSSDGIRLRQPWYLDSSRLLAAIVQSSEGAIITKDLEGIVTGWNPAATRILGYLPDEIIGQPILHLVPIDLREEEMEMMVRLRAGRELAISAPGG